MQLPVCLSTFRMTQVLQELASLHTWSQSLVLPSFRKVLEEIQSP